MQGLDGLALLGKAADSHEKSAIRGSRLRVGTRPIRVRIGLSGLDYSEAVVLKLDVKSFSSG